MAELRTYCFLDILQPQFAAFVASTGKGFLPVERQAALYVEVAPGIEINRVTDVALKKTGVQPAVQVVERAFGLLEVHSFDQGEVREAGQGHPRVHGARGEGPHEAQGHDLAVDHEREPIYHATLVNRNRGGSMLLGGQTLLHPRVPPGRLRRAGGQRGREGQPDHAHRAPPLRHLGRLWLGGTEAHIAEASKAAIAALEAVGGRAAK